MKTLGEENQVLAVVAQEEAWRRIRDIMKGLTTKLEGLGPKSTIHDSLIGNIMELAEAIPILNVGQDPEFDSMSYRLKKAFRHMNAENQKENYVLQAEAKQNAIDIISEVTKKIFGRVGAIPCSMTSTPSLVGWINWIQETQ